MAAKKKIGHRFASSVIRAAKNIEQPKGYSVPLDADVVQFYQAWSRETDIPVVRLVNRVLRATMTRDTRGNLPETTIIGITDAIADSAQPGNPVIVEGKKKSLSK